MMSATWHRLVEHLNERSLRERLLIFATVTISLLLLIRTLALQPLAEAQQEKLRDIGTSQLRITALEQEIGELRIRYRRDPDLAVRHQIEQLEQQLHLHEQPLAEITRGMIDPSEMAGVIESILKKNRHLKIIRLENLPATPLIEEAVNEEDDEGEKEDSGHDVPIYKHGLSLEVSGSYGNLVAMLHDLETQPWRILWGEVELASEKYPISRLSLVIYTLSFEPSWLAV